MVDNSLNASLQIRHTGAKMDFSSLTAYQSNYRYYKTPVDGDFSPLDIISIVNNYGKPWNKVDAWTEELRLSSPTASVSPLKWAVGSYLFLQKAPNKQGVHFGADASLAGSPDSNYTIINTTQIKNKGLAFYGQLEYALSKKIQRCRLAYATIISNPMQKFRALSSGWCNYRISNTAGYFGQNNLSCAHAHALCFIPGR